MRSNLLAVSLLFLSTSAACVEAPDDAVETSAAELGIRYCSSDFDCDSLCSCISGTCQASSGPYAGPPPDQLDCSLPPERECSVPSDCRTACDCVGGVCQADGFGPPPPGDWCALPPPDEYEPNDSLTEASSYLGSPQVHTFHDPDNDDFVWIYIPSSMTATFDTSDTAGTEMWLYRYTGTSWPPTSWQWQEVGYNDNKCGIWYWPECWNARITAAVTEGLYAVQIRNQLEMNAYQQTPPSYIFQVW